MNTFINTHVKTKTHSIFCLLIVFFVCIASAGFAQSPGCPNADFSLQNFTNWVGNTSIYPYNTPGSNVSSGGIPYYYNTGIVPGRHTIITTSTPDPYTCGNVMTLPPGETQCVRLGNGGINPNATPAAWTDGVGWQRDYLSYTFGITSSNSLLIYKYAVVLQDPTNDPNNPPHPQPIKPRFIVTIKDASGHLVDTVCGKKEDYADTTTAGYRNCTNAAATALGGNTAAGGDIVYRAWTTVGVDLRAFISQNVTIQFETWDCGLGGHFGYAYITARCDTMGIAVKACNQDGSVSLTAPPGFSYQWLPSGQTSQTINLFNVQPGDTAYCELTTLDGCKTSVRTTIYPTFTNAYFTPHPDVVCFGTPIAMTDSSSSIYTFNNSHVPIIDWSWNFGDGDSSHLTNPTHLYATPGTYSISLNIVDQNGCKDNVSHVVQVLPAPVADFSFSPVCEKKSVAFTDVSQIIGTSGSIGTWDWTFSDNGSHSALQNPVHFYPTAGTYSITLHIETDKGCKDDTMKTIKIWPNPTVTFTATEACEGDPVVFTDHSIAHDPADNLMSWIWNFGDLSNLNNIQNPSHIYIKDSTYYVQLIVTTSKNCIEDTILPVYVHSQPTAHFTATPSCLNTPVQFTDLSVPAADVIGWTWQFDDATNNASNLQSPTHLYDTSKVYFPVLTVYSAYGCSSSVSLPLNIPPLPEANFDSDKYEGCSPLCVNFIDLSYSAVDPVVSWDWNFGDNSGSTIKSPYHCYNVPGTYTVSLDITTQNTCKSSFVWNAMIHVYPIPVAAFTLSPEETTESDGMIYFTNLAAGADYWLWTFGDGNVSTLPDTNHLYQAAGTYHVWQYVRNTHGCKDSIEHTLVVNPEWAYYVPNVFSPNGDGRNDFFIGKGFNVSDFKMWIFDRWGNMIYYTNNENEPWNGKVNNGANGELKAQEDVYVYKIKLRDVFDKPHQYIGSFTLIK